jgi:hypothetical protein
VSLSSKGRERVAHDSGGHTGDIGGGGGLVSASASSKSPATQCPAHSSPPAFIQAEHSAAFSLKLLHRLNALCGFKKTQT